MIARSEEGFIFGGYTPCKWKYNKDKSTVNKGKDASLTSFLYVLRTKFEGGPRLFKLKKEKQHSAVSYHNNTAFDFGCNDFYFFNGKVWSHKEDCCYEFYDRTNGIRLCGQSWNTKPTEIEIYQLH